MAGKKEKRDVISDLDLANYLHSTRSPKAQAVDNGTKARVTKNIGLYVAEPSRYDWEGVDTPKRNRNPVIKKKARGKLSNFGVKI